MTLKLLPLPAVALALLAAAAPSAHAAGGCTSRIVDFDATRVNLNAKVIADWRYGNGDVLGKASLATTQTQALRWRGRIKQAATFNELSRGCRLGDRFQGGLDLRLQSIPSRLRGSWSAGDRGDSCDTRHAMHTRIKAEFIRRERHINPHARTVNLHWSFRPLRSLDCPFYAYDSGDYERQHLRMSFDVPSTTQVLRKSKLLGHRRTLRLHVRVERPLRGWPQGRVDGSLTYDLTVVLKRVKDCTIGPNDPIAGNRCLRPA